MTDVRIFKVLGTTDEVTTCEYCGRPELKGTVVLDILDVDGNSEGTAYYGTGCAATAGKRTAKDIRDSAKAANQAKRDAEQAAADAKNREWTAKRNAWIAENIGSDALDNPRKYGYNGPVAVVKEFLKVNSWS